MYGFRIFFALLKMTLQQAVDALVLCCNNAVPLLNKVKTLTFRSMPNFKKFEIYLDFVCQPASQPASQPACRKTH